MKHHYGRRTAVAAAVPAALGHPQGVARVQSVLRCALVVLLVVEASVFPDRHNVAAGNALIAAYGVWSVLRLRAVWREQTHPRLIWAVLIVDLAVLVGLVVLTRGFPVPETSLALIDDAFFVVAMMASFQLQPRTTIALMTLTASVYLAAATGAGAGPRSLLAALMHTLFLVTVGMACALTSWVHRARVQTINTLVKDRSQLLIEVLNVEERERSTLAEALHDNALQSVLAARQDIEDARAATSPAESLERAERTLTDAARQMRSVAAELHPAVLENLGLAGAVRAAAHAAAERGAFSVDVQCKEGLHHPQQQLVFTAARELLTNVVKHAAAQHVTVHLTGHAGSILLEITDDGRGITHSAVQAAPAAGHIGLASQRIRIENADGTLTLTPATPHGTRAVLELPPPAL
ncbi:hypothetical protein SSP24_78740 [Streptomyces spinoverrucosus]|uniref:Histidine kinase/HSP90-like ATPase domain-containing protein n=1 Tax=Streptomyces spinoverrucosus TaxID=284043 RepID=A0A4Y3VWY6_9ACTN|nr:ATP-binding protein [Streptomyces spinoverrucosus]GEC10219.1 hypothetical protein SSP24_78740 [Streptomyces spinoverrucosus]GHB96396.1 hypothetical protein GCM10010397_81340 [Streptomyces spinoverrucosus]